MALNAESRHPVTLLLERFNRGDRSAENDLMEAVYDALRKMAAVKVSRLAPGQTLQATALVNEAYIKLSGGTATWQNRAHFFGAAARAMRNIIVDQARRKASMRHGGDQRRAEFDTRIAEPSSGDPDRLLDLEEALQRLEADQPRAARVVDLRFFVGMSDDETAESMGLSVRTVYREWSYAKAWLRRELDNGFPEARAR